VHIYANEKKMRSVETITEMGEWVIKENDGGGEFNYEKL
jgi:hypothetical protein